jgi:hypothetical protein
MATTGFDMFLPKELEYVHLFEFGREATAKNTPALLARYSQERTISLLSAAVQEKTLHSPDNCVIF